MGLIAYVFPVLLLVGTFFAVSNRGNRVATVKLVAMILFDLFLCMLIELLTKGLRLTVPLRHTATVLSTGREAASSADFWHGFSARISVWLVLM